MLPKKETFEELAKLNYTILKNSFALPMESLSDCPSIIVNNKNSFPLFSNHFSLSNFLEKLSDEVYSKKFLKDCTNAEAADETIRLMWHISLLETSLKRKHNSEVMTQLDLYSKIVQDDPLLLTILQLIEWLEEIYPIPSKIVKNIVDFNSSAKLQETLPPEKQLSFDIDTIATATEYDMDPKEREEFKNLMRSVYYLLRKGQLAKAEDLLESCSQVICSTNT